jgi:Leucine-rich repeat (LRR) protein
MKNFLLLVLLLACSQSIFAQLSKSLTLITAGTLSSTFTDEELSNVTDLTLAGNIDARDFKTMRDMMPLLANIDLSSATIVAYSGTEGTSMEGRTFYPANAIPEYAFMYKKTLNSFNLPNSALEISSFAFGNNWGLKSITISPNILAIKPDAFAGCYNVTQIYIPASVQSIENAFDGNEGLFNVDGDNQNYSSLDGVLFDKSQRTLISCPRSISGAYTIPNSVEIIGNIAFGGCYKLTSIQIPSSVKIIRDGAFDQCYGVTEFVLPSSIEFIGNRAFFYCSGMTSFEVKWLNPLDLTSISDVFLLANVSNCTLKVPFGTSSLYSNAKSWEDFQSIIEMPEIKKTYVPDDNFEQALIDLGYDSGALDDYVLTANISGVTSLNVSNKVISNLTGVEGFSALSNLICSNNILTSLDLSKNLELRNLDCSKNKLSTLDLSPNRILTFLRCQYNALTSLKLPPNQFLSQVYCGNNQLEFINLSQNPKITQLGCNNNKITVLDVSNLTELGSLECYVNNIGSLNLINNQNLRILDCSDNPLNNIDLKSNGNLESLYCGRTNISTLDVTQNKKLSLLACEDNLLPTLDVSQNPLLESLYCHRNRISSLDLSANAKLLRLYAYNNLLSTVNLSNNPLIQWLYIENNKLNILDVIKCQDLLKLRCYSNQISSLDLTQNIKLQYLDCSVNSLTSLKLNNGKNSFLSTMNSEKNPNLLCIQVDNPSLAATYNWQKDLIASYSSDCSPRTYVPDDNFEQALIDLGYDSGALDDFVPTTNINSITNLNVDGRAIADLKGIEDFQSLKELYCQYNTLTVLDLSKNLTLERLACRGNQLTSLDLTKNTKLNMVDCMNNKLQSINVTNLIKLAGIWCNSNQLSNIDVSTNTGLYHLICADNMLTVLDLTSNLSLVDLACQNNQISVLDLHKQKYLRSLTCNDNQLVSLNIQNGNNSNMPVNEWYYVHMHNNPKLFCIQVDNPILAATYSSWQKDAQAGYSGNCAIPVANAGTDQQVNEATLVVLDGTASYDSYGDPLTYTWTAPAGIILNLDNPSKPSFTAPNVDKERNYTFTLMVNDGTENSMVDAAIVTVKPVNYAPNVICNGLTINLDASGNYMLSPGDLKLLATGTADDKDSFKNLKIVAEPSSFSCQDLGNTVSVKITVSDSEGASSFCYSSIEVKDVTPPTFSSIPKSFNMTIATGGTYILPDFSELYPAKDGCSSVTYSQFPAPGKTYTAAAKETVTLKATDQYGNSAQISIPFILTVRSKLKSAEINISDEFANSPQLEVYPNPFKERAYFDLISPYDADILLDIIDAKGAKIATLFSGHIRANQKQTFEYTPSGVATQTVFYRLLINDEIKTGKLILKN